MPRKTKKTLRKMRPLTKELLKVANELDRLNRRLIVLAEKVDDKEIDSAALQSMMTTFNKEKAPDE